MVTRKVYVLVENDTIKCYHNLKQLTDANNLPYFSIVKTLKAQRTYKRPNILIGVDTIAYKTKRTNPNLNH
jgi:hypothetical protein